MALYADVTNTTVQKLIEAVALSIRQPGGSILTEYVDGRGASISAGVPSAQQATLGKADEFQLSITVNPGGNSAVAKVVCKSPRGVYSIEGPVDLTVLATKLV